MFLLLWVINWIGSFSGPTVDKLTQYLSIIDHFDDFAKGVIDTTHLIYYLSFITLRPVPDRQVGRQRTVARIRSYDQSHSQSRRLARHGAGLRRRRYPLRRTRQRSSTSPIWRGPALRASLVYMVGQWREIAHAVPRPAGALRHAGGVSVLVVLGILVAINYIGARQNKRWDLTANKAVQPVGSDTQRPRQARCAAADHGLRAGARFPALSGQAEGIRVRVEAGHDRVRRSRQEADRRQAESGSAVRHDRLQLQGPHRARHGRHRAGHHQRHHQGGHRPAEEGLLHAGPRRKDTDVERARRLQRHRRSARARKLHGREARARAEPARCPTMRRS